MTAKVLQEAVWAALPRDLAPHEFELRREFLLAHVRPGQAVLDLGCGEGAFSGLLADAGTVPVGIDIAPTALARARSRHPGIDFRLAATDAALPLHDASISVCWVSEVLAHVVDTAGLLSEVRRVLAPRGRVLITTPHHGHVRRLALALAGFERAFDPRGPHVRFYTPRSLREVLEDYGFEVERLEAAGGPPLLRRLILARARRALPAIAGR